MSQFSWHGFGPWAASVQVSSVCAPLVSFSPSIIITAWSAHMIYSLTGTVALEHTLLSSLDQQHQLSHARAHIYYMALTALSEACLHSALLYPCNLRAVNWHISHNVQIQYSEGIQKSRFSYRALCNCDLRTAQVVLAISWDSSSQIRVFPINLKPITSWLLQSLHLSICLCQDK